MFASNTTNVNEQPDAQFNYVTMLLHGDGTNGAQNNTFLDSSTNNFSITRNGNTTQGTFSPYGDNWSNYFDGSGTFFTISTSATAAFQFNADFTWEGWIFPLSFPSNKCIFSTMANGSTSTGIDLGIGSDGKLYVYRGASAGFQGYSTNPLTLNQWNHFALVRSGSTCTYYINGVANGTFTMSTNLSDGYCYIGTNNYDTTTRPTCYFSNLRMVKGTAVYTAAFTPSTSPLTAITNTSLLTCQSNRFRDASSNNFAITVNGSPSVQRFSPFAPTAAYSAATIGGSGYFDGSDYLLAPASSNLEFGSGDFTIEFWWYTTVSSRQALYHGSFGTDWSIGIDCSSQKMGIWASSNGTSWNLINADGGGNGVGTITVPINQWNHIAYVRSGTTWMLYVNGVRDLNLTGISGSIVNRSSDQKAIGAWWSAGVSPGPTTGYIQDFRIVKGTALYTGSTYTVPTAPLTAITNTSLLCSFTNAGIIDNAMMNDLETVGNAQISTSVKKYGTGSLAFDGTGDGLTLNAGGQNFAFGTGNFTIEMWVYPSTSSQSGIIYDSRPTSTSGLYPTIRLDSGTLKFYTSGASQITGGTLSANTWYHIAVCRSGTSTRLFIDGAQSGSTYTDSNSYINGAARPLIGADGFDNYTGSNYFNGYIDDLRITKGYARYTSNFTAPTAAFPNT